MFGLVITIEFTDGLKTDIAGIDIVMIMPEPATILMFTLGTMLFKKKPLSKHRVDAVNLGWFISFFFCHF